MVFQLQAQTIGMVAPWWVVPLAYVYQGVIFAIPLLLIYGGWRFLRASQRRRVDEDELAALRERVQALEEKLGDR